MLNVKKLLTKVLSNLSSIGTVYIASWTATSASANSTPLTGSITVPSGTYVLVVTSPIASANFSIGVAGMYKQMLANGDTFTLLFQSTQGGSIRAETAQSALVTFSNTERGSIRAIKIG